MSKYCRTCRHYYQDGCSHPDMIQNGDKFYSKLLLELFDKGVIYKELKRYMTYEDVDNLFPALEETMWFYTELEINIEFQPKDDREFCCSL